jgi:hypothetical protein
MSNIFNLTASKNSSDIYINNYLDQYFQRFEELVCNIYINNYLTQYFQHDDFEHFM